MNDGFAVDQSYEDRGSGLIQIHQGSRWIRGWGETVPYFTNFDIWHRVMQPRVMT